MVQKIIRIGNSIGMVIPQQILHQVQLKLGDEVVVEIDARDESLVVYPKGKGAKRSAITPEFLEWLDKFNKRHASALKELAGK